MRFSRRRRLAISEVFGSLIMVAVTLIAGAAVFGFVNTQANTGASQYGQSVANNVNNIRERFVVVNVVFPSLNCAGASPNRFCKQFQISIFNNGALSEVLNSITLVNVGPTSPGGTTVLPLSLTIGQTTTSTTYNGSSCPAATVARSDSSPSVGLGTFAIPQGAAPTVVTVTLNCTSNPILVGGNYQIQVIGAFGNTVTTQITANG